MAQGTSAITRKAYTFDGRPSDARSFGNPPPTDDIPLPHHAGHPRKNSDHRLRDRYRHRKPAWRRDGGRGRVGVGVHPPPIRSRKGTGRPKVRGRSKENESGIGGQFRGPRADAMLFGCDGRLMKDHVFPASPWSPAAARMSRQRWFGILTNRTVAVCGTDPGNKVSELMTHENLRSPCARASSQERGQADAGINMESRTARVVDGQFRCVGMITVKGYGEGGRATAGLQGFAGTVACASPPRPPFGESGYRARTERLSMAGVESGRVRGITRTGHSFAVAQSRQCIKLISNAVQVIAGKHRDQGSAAPVGLDRCRRGMRSRSESARVRSAPRRIVRAGVGVAADPRDSWMRSKPPKKAGHPVIAEAHQVSGDA